MPCYSPLHAFKAKANDSSKISITFSRPSSWKGDRLDLPCGQCIGCRLERSRQWAVRCMHEASLHEQNSFITLTYDDEHLPKDWSLQKSHFQNFMKRLRKSISHRVRYYHCGEYGDLNARPHYHALLFGHDFSDKRLHSERKEVRLFTSDQLQRLWPMGFSTIGEVTFESAAYVARYVMKKINGPAAEDHYYGRTPEYTTMSRRPGIAQKWYEKFKSDVYPRDYVVSRGFKSRPPRYYDNLLGREDQSTLALLKINREKSSIKYVDDVLSNGKIIKELDSSSRRLAVKEIVKQAEISQLKRTLED